MHLVIAGADSPSAIDDEAAVTPPFAAFVLEPERAYMNPKPGRGGSLPHLRQNDVPGLWSQSRRSARAIPGKLASHFGRVENIRSDRLGSVDRLLHPPCIPPMRDPAHTAALHSRDSVRQDLWHQISRVT